MAFVDHFYVTEDLTATQLITRNHKMLADALSDYYSLPSDKAKALGIYTISGGAQRNMPGMYDFLQCKNGFDTVIEDWKNPATPWWQNGEIQSAYHAIKSVRDVRIIPHETGVTKEALRQRLSAGEHLDDILDLSEGQECLVFKADRFYFGTTIIYIPDVFLNDVPYHRACTQEEIDHVVSMCYTGDDFLNICQGNMITAIRVFYGVDWQHPSSAADEEWVYSYGYEPKWLTGEEDGAVESTKR